MNSFNALLQSYRDGQLNNYLEKNTMARWANNTADTSLRVLYDPLSDDAELTVLSVDAIQGQIKADNTQSLGVRLKCRFVGGPYDTKMLDVILWLHTEDSVRITKQNQMAVFGYEQKREAEFNDWSRNIDWTVDGDNKELGDGWRAMVGRNVNAKIDVKPNKQTGELQQVVILKPIV